MDVADRLGAPMRIGMDVSCRLLTNIGAGGFVTDKRREIIDVLRVKLLGGRFNNRVERRTGNCEDR